MKKPGNMNKPKFDPSKGFEVIDLRKPKFDDSKPFESAEQPKDTTMKAAAAGLGQGVTLGYAPQLGAAIAPAIDKGIEFFTGMRAPQDTYVQRRDENIREQQALADSNPIAYGVGNVAGGIATSAAPMSLAARLGMLGKGAGASKAFATAKEAEQLSRAYKIGQATGQGAKTVGQAAATGAGIAAITNPGDVEGETSPFQLGQRIENAKTGALVGGLSQGLVGGVGSIAKGAASGAKSLAETKAFKATGAMLKDFRKADKNKSVQEIGRQLLDDKVVTAGSTPKKIVAKLESLIDDSTATIENAIQKIDKGSGQVDDILKQQSFTGGAYDQAQKLKSSFFKPAEVAERLKAQIKEKYSEIPTEKLKAAFDEIDSWFSGMPETLSISKVHALKKQMGKFLKESDFYKRGADLGLAKEGTLAVRRGLKEGVEKQADTVSQILGGAGGEVKKANKRLGNLLTVKDVAQDRISRDAANRAFGLTDNIWGAAGMAGGGGVAGGLMSGDLEGAAKGAITGAAFMGGNKLARTYGNSLMAVGFDKAANALMKIPKYAELAQQNPAQFQTLVNKMIQSPENETAMQRRLKEQ